ncbi:hypothetical protein [Streptomyces sp. AN091965]|uniref:hypothetical protein n=1 Tax=Streptomyces sp. AN091965 TaxID=2927803 RepID=UPI001F6067E8|nr:hypothetical protein [Streptomyces sp. AN091965]MCI3934362.1 hypothetical protein [Streptomyces sp. AN091965]
MTAIDLATLYRVMDVDPDAPLRVLLRKARALSPSLPGLVLSAAVAEGAELGTGSADELRRVTARVDAYRRIAEHCSTAYGARSVKGVSLLERYPARLLRGMGDLDLVLPDEQALWRSVAHIMATHPVTEVAVSVIDGARRHILATPRWPAEDPVLDPELKVDLTTFAFAGDHATVPLRPALPADPVVADLLMLADERTQRPFNVKDALDTTVLTGGADAPSAAALAAAARDFRLAPELWELLRRTHELTGAPPESSWAGLPEAAAAEEALRTARGAAGGTEPDDTEARMAAGLPVHGFPLRFRSRPHWQRARICRAAGCVLLRTPVSDHLLVGGGQVAVEDYHRALAAVGELPD